MAPAEKKQYPARKQCRTCKRKRLIKFFRLLSSGYRQGMCVDCERAYERDRWHTRSAASKAASGQAATSRRRRGARGS